MGTVLSLIRKIHDNRMNFSEKKNIISKLQTTEIKNNVVTNFILINLPAGVGK